MQQVGALLTEPLKDVQQQSEGVHRLGVGGRQYVGLHTGVVDLAGVSPPATH